MSEVLRRFFSPCAVAGVLLLVQSTVSMAGTCPPESRPPAGASPYVSYTTTDDLVFVSGQIGLDPAAPGPAPDFESQMMTALDRLEGSLEAAGSSVDGILKVTVFLSDPGDMATMNRLYRAFFESRGAELPARSLVPGLNFGVMPIAVEIEAIAERQPCELPVRTSYVSIPVTHEGRDWPVAGRLQFPVNTTTPAPAVLILHGSAGVDSRGSHHAQALNALGFVTLELDLWAARGWVAARSGRPAGVPETLPDAFAAFNYLTDMPEVDGSRIGVTGFSWGGVMAVLTATEDNIARYAKNGQRFAAHAPFYPVCWVYDAVPGYELTSLSTVPMLILTGALDDYDTPATCPELAARYETRSDIEVVVYPDAYHGFNAIGMDMEVVDPFSHLGRGGTVRFKSNPAARAQAVARVNDFFLQQLKN